MIAALVLALVAVQEDPADLVVIGRVFTSDLETPRAEAVAIRGDRIAAVGTRAAIEPFIGEGTRVIDAGEASVVPGFNDAHCHFTVGFGFAHDVDVSAATGLEEILAAVAAYAEAHPDAEAIEGTGWDLSDMPDEAWPTRAMLDAVVANRPVVLWSEGPHGVWANSVALEMAGIDAETEDAIGLRVIRDAEGEPDGVVLGRGLIFRFAFGGMPDLDVLRAGIGRGMQEAPRLGVTSVQEPVSSFLVPYLATLHERGDLTVRFHVWDNLVSGPNARARERYARDDWIVFGALKGGVDGMPGLRTAALLAPYADDPTTSGLVTIDLDEMRADVREANADGLAVAMHATGDRGVRLALDAFAAARREDQPRNRVEHAFVVSPDDLGRFAELGVVCSVQPSFLATELAKDRYYDRRFGEERRAHVLPLRSLLDAGAVLAFGTDFSLTPLDPLVGLHAAVTRLGWVPEQRITLAEAIRAYTYGSAFAEGAEEEKGRLLPGMLADLVVLSEDVFALEPDALLDVEVAVTIVGGKVVYER